MLLPGKAYLLEQIRIANPTDGMHPYYFWNCTAFPNRPGTRFIYPMTLGTDHTGTEFFTWPIHKGKDLTWLKNYEVYTSVFAHKCEFDFFGAYDVDADRGLVSAANHHLVSGKKAWTWGEWDFGKMAQKNLTDEDGPYIEVQSGPLPTQSDYGLLGPHDRVFWEEYWYPVHGLGDGFEFATKDLAVQTARKAGELQLRLLATSKFAGATCAVVRGGKEILSKKIDLGPEGPQIIAVPAVGQDPVEIRVSSTEGKELARFTTPLPIPKVTPPSPEKFKEKPDEQLSVEQLSLKGEKFLRATNRLKAREYYEKALARDPGYLPALRGLAVMDFEAALYPQAIKRLEKALERYSDDGLSWYFMGASYLRQNNLKEAMRCGFHAARCQGTIALGYDLAGRAAMRLKDYLQASELMFKSLEASFWDGLVHEHVALAMYAQYGVTHKENQGELIKRFIQEDPSMRSPNLVRMAIRALLDSQDMAQLVKHVRTYLGEPEFEILETALVFAEVGLAKEAAQIVQGVLVEGVKDAEQAPLPLYYLAYFSSLQGDQAVAKTYLQRAAKIDKDFIFASRPEEVDILKYAVGTNPGDANAHLHLGNLYANLGRLDEAKGEWQKAAALKPTLAMAQRNLGLLAWARGDLAGAETLYRKAVAARPSDQTLFRDLGELLVVEGKRSEAIRVMEAMPVKGTRREEITIDLAQAYVDEKRYGDAVKLLEGTPYFVNWEGQDVTWWLFNKAHVERGQERFGKKDFSGALADFEAALTYPVNLNVGRSNQPQESKAQYSRGQALEALGRHAEARAAWKEGAAGAAGSGKGREEQNQHRELCRQLLKKVSK